MNDLMRPALYNSKHRIIPALKIEKKVQIKHMNLWVQSAKLQISLLNFKKFSKIERKRYCCNVRCWCIWNVT